MSYTDLLTIAMPCYERKEFFKDALDSALNQTVKCKIIVIDNCSSHNYFEEVCRDKGVDYFRNEKNIGIIGNFSRCFELSKTKFTMNLQDDDLLEPTYVEYFLKALEDHPDIDIFFTDFMLLTMQGEKQHEHTLPFGFMENGKRIIEYGIRYKLGFPYMSSTIKTKVAHRYSEVSGCRGSFDWEWIYGKADQLKFFGDYRKLYKYRQHNNQDTNQNSWHYILTIPFIYEKVLMEKVSDKKIKKIATRHACWLLIYLKSISNRKILKEIERGNTKYERYFKSKLDEDFMIRFVFKLPSVLVRTVLRILVKFGIRY